jgi:putative tryptophan/tyrosine transport system permease protein
MLELLSFINDALYDGLPYALVCLSFVITAKYIRFPDVTCSGSFVLGGAIAATAIVRAGMDPVTASVLAGLAGAAAGLLTAFFYTTLRLDRLLSGILSAFVIYSINLMLLTPTVAYGDRTTLLSAFEVKDRAIVAGTGSWHPWAIALLCLLVLATKMALDRFLDSEVGLAMRCLEDEQAGEYALERQGLSPDRFKVIALCVGNSIVGIAGALVSFKEGAANAQRGFDVLITALVAFLLGSQLLSVLIKLSKPRSWLAGVRITSGAIAGALAYFALMTVSQRLQIASELTKILLVALVALSAAQPSRRFASWRRRRQSVRRPEKESCVLRVEDLAYRYPSADKDSLPLFSLAVESGQVVQLAGGNGSGKTTALRVIAGFIDAQHRGGIFFRGIDLTGARHERLKRIAYVDQNADRGVVGTLTAEENLVLASISASPSIWRSASRRTTLDHVAAVLKRGPLSSEVLPRQADQLSGGQRQVLNLLTLLARRDAAAVVLLDEPTNNLDSRNAEHCRQIIKQLHDDGAAIVLVSHSTLPGVEIDKVIALSERDVTGTVLAV